MRRLAFLVLLATAASAQPVLAPDSVQALAQRAARAGLIADSTAALFAQCASEGVPVTRSALVGAVAAGQGVAPFPTEMWAYNPDSLVSAPVPRWADSLAAAGLLTAADLRVTAPLVDSVLATRPAGLPPEATVPIQLRVIQSLAAQRATLDPAWLAEDARQWVARGLMITDGRDRLLAAARRGELLNPNQTLHHLDIAEPTGVSYTGWTDSDDQPLDTLAALVDAGVRLLRRRGVADFQVEGLAVDSVRYWTSSGWGEGGERLQPVLSARIDGVVYRQEIGYSGSPLTLLNRVLRDRRSAYRLHTAALPSLRAPRVERVVLVLSVADAALLSTNRLRDLSPPRRAVIEAAGRAGRESPCRDLAFNAFTVAAFEVDTRGPLATGREGALTRDGLARTLRRLAAVGLMNHLSDQARAEVREVLERRYLRRPQEILEAIPDLVFAYHGDDATYDADQPYAEVIQDLARISRGSFRPRDVTDTFSFEADSARVGFTEGGQRYETTVEVSSWLYSSFLDLAAEAVRDHEARLYRLGRYTEDGYVFATRQQWAALATLGLLGDGAGPVDVVGSSD